MSRSSHTISNSNRIVERFQALKAARQSAFIAFVTAGDPDLYLTARLMPRLEEVGVDLVELGVPFSDPIADGPTIQRSSQRALARGVTLKKVFGLVKEIRRQSQIPIALMSYCNPIWRFGLKAAIEAARASGCDGLIIPDLIPEEAGELIQAARPSGICTIFFAAPTSHHKRITLAAHSSTGFLYYVSLTGVTGEREALPTGLAQHLRLVRSLASPIPVCVGFGISSPQQARHLAPLADGVIVGSTIVRFIEEHPSPFGFTDRVAEFVKPFVEAVKGNENLKVKSEKLKRKV